MAPRKPQDHLLEKLPCSADDGYLEGTSHQTPGSPEDRRDVHSRLESEHDHGGRDLSIPVMASTAETADQEQGQAFGGSGAHEDFGGDSATCTRSEHCLEIPLHEQVAAGQRLESRCGLPMDADGDTGSSPSITEDLLSQCLATRGCGPQTPDSSTEPLAKQVAASLARKDR